MNPRTIFGAVVVVALCTASSLAFAQNEAETAARRVMLEQAQAARDSGDHARALDLASRAGRLQMTPSLRLFIAEEQLLLRQYAPALGTAELCVRETERDVNVRNRETIIGNCRNIVTQARPRVGYIRVQVPTPAPPELRVTVNGTPVNEVLFGVPYPVTPGTIAVAATATDRVAFRNDVTIAAGATLDVQVEMRPAPVSTGTGATGTTATTGSGTAGSGSAGASGSGGSTTTGTGDSGATGAGTTSTGGTSGGSTSGAGASSGGSSSTGDAAGGTSTGGSAGGASTGAGNGTTTVDRPRASGVPGAAIALLGVGGAGLLGSGIFLLLNRSAIGDCMVDATGVAECPTQESADRAAGAGTFAALSWVTLGVGGAALIAGAVWLGVGLSGGSRPATTAARTTFGVAPTMGGLSFGMRGGF